MIARGMSSKSTASAVVGRARHRRFHHGFADIVDHHVDTAIVGRYQKRPLRRRSSSSCLHLGAELTAQGSLRVSARRGDDACLSPTFGHQGGSRPCTGLFLRRVAGPVPAMAAKRARRLQVLPPYRDVRPCSLQTNGAWMKVRAPRPAEAPISLDCEVIR